MSFDLSMVRIGDALFVSHEMFLEELRAIPERQPFLVSGKPARHIEQHNLFFATLSEIIKCGAWDGDIESLLDYLKIGVGHVTTVTDPNGASWVPDNVKFTAEAMLQKRDGLPDEVILLAETILAAGPKVYLVPRSISFAAMGQDKFKRFFNRVEWFLAERMGIDIAALRLRTAESAGPMPPPAEATKIEEPLDERLRAMAFELGFVGSIDATHKHWAEMKTRPEVKALHQRAPAELRELVEAAQEKARGKLSETQFDAMVKAIAARVVRESEAV